MLQVQACSKSVWYGKAPFLHLVSQKIETKKQEISFSLQATPEKLISQLYGKCHTV